MKTNKASSSLFLALAASVNAQTGQSIGPLTHRQHRRAVTSSPIEPPEEDDFTFVVNEDVGLDTDRMGKDDPTLTFTVKITRVFGDIAKQQAAGVLSDTAAVFLPAYDVDFADGEWDQIILNGTPLTPYLTGDNGVWKLNTYYVPLDILNFPADPGPGGTVQPADNVFTVAIDLSGDDTNWVVSFDWAAIQFLKAPRPVVLFHGLLSDSTVWASQWVTKLDSLGILNDATGNLGNFDSIQSNADLVAATVAAARARWGVREVDIVAHSKGALDARHYAETATDVANVIQVAGPNGGTPLADFGQLASIAALSASNTVILNYFASVAAVQLTTDYMAVYNSVHRLNGDVDYTSLAGDYDPDCAAATPSCRLLDRLFLSISGSPGDIVVPQWSAHHLKDTSKLTHVSIWSDESAKHYPLIQSEDVFDQLQDLVPTSLDTALVAPSPDYQITLSLAGTVAQGDTFEAYLDLDGTTEAYVVLLYPSDTLGLTLIATDATTVNTTYAASNPSILGYEDSDFFDGKIAAYNLVSPEPGRWLVQVTGDAVTSSEIPFVVNAFLYQPDVKLEASLGSTSVLTGAPLVYFAEVTDNGTPVLAATAKATVALPDNTLTTVTLLDDGVAPDVAANDGVYTGSLTDTSQSGNYRAAVSVEKTGSPSFTREAFVLGAVYATTIACSNYREVARDTTDRDTLYNFLDIIIDVSASVPADYVLLATLTDSAGNEQVVSRSVSIADGATAATFTFDGETIFFNGVNGPYTLSSVRVAAESNFDLAIVAELKDVYTTTAYSYTAFQRDPLRLVGGTTQGVDTNANSLFDRLDIEMFVESTIAGSYEWSATLRDSEDTEIGFDFGTITIASGSNTIDLSFDGVTIGNNWVDGPYFVSDFILFGAVGAESLVVNSKAYTTDALLWREFEHTMEPPTVSPYPSLSPTDYPTTSPTANPTSSPTTSPTSSPTGSPTTSPTGSPTTSPTGSPTTSPTANPTAHPTGSPTASPTGSPTTTPTGSPIIVDTDGDGLSDNYERDPNPYVTNPDLPDTDGDGLTDAEEDALDTDPNNKDTDGDGLEDGYEVNISKTDPLERQPTPAPTKAPTRSPTSSPSSNPSGSPSASPSLLPSSQPSIVTQIVRTPGTISTNKEFCSFSAAERAAFTDASERTLVEFACPGSETCTASITSSCGQSQVRRRDLSSSSRQLQASSNWQIEYVVVEEFTCERATCTSSSDIARVNAIAKTIATNMNDSMSSGQFLTSFSAKIIQSAALDDSLVECLIVWGTVGSPETEVGSGGTGVFYPDWTDYSGTCLQDGNEPSYMKLSTIWLSDSLEECCSRFYPGWNFNKCMNPNGSGLWYVDHENGKCVTDCDEASGGTCGGYANLVSNDLYASPRSCCEAELFYRYIEFCEADSLLSECYKGTGLFYRGDNGGKEVCARDCDPASGDTTCGGIVEDSYIVLYETAEACCTAEYNWIDVNLCAARTTETSFGKYWPDKDNAKCLKDSEMPSGQLDVQVFDTLEACCASGIFWLSKSACFAASGIAEAEVMTNKYYIDWINQLCVQDCEGSAPCGGLAQAWDTLYESASACCARLPGRTADDCVYS